MAKSRYSEYTVEDLNKAKAYYKHGLENKEMLPSVVELAVELGRHRDTIYYWATQNEEFKEVLGMIKELQELRLIQNGITSRYNTPMSIFLLKANHGMIETNRQEVTGKDGDGLLLKFTKDEGADS